MMVPLKVIRSTIAAQSLGSVKVFVQPEKDSLEAIATDAGQPARHTGHRYLWETPTADRAGGL